MQAAAEVAIPSPASPPSESTPKHPAAERCVTLDAFRGFIMLMLCASGFGFGALSRDPRFAAIAAQFDHVAWEGAVFWDLIQPAFMFMVGAAMPFAMAKREMEGATFGANFRHAAARSFRLLLLSQILMCISAGRLNFQLINVLAQMAFTYLFCFLILQLRFRAQVVTAALILAGHSALFLAFAQGFSQTDNIGAVIDRFLLGRNYSGYYVTINFATSIVTTLAGAWAAQLLISGRSVAPKMKVLAACAAGCFAAGLALAPVIPLVKRIWTASFTLYSTGWVLLMLIAFYWMIDVRGWRRAAFPMVAVGMNSIFIYSIHQVLQGWINRAVGVFTGKFEFIGTLAPVAQATAVLAVMWYLCYWLYQRKIFFKL
jgi:predicted acyltransferase